MPRETWLFRIQHIIDSAERIARYTHEMSRDEFVRETMTVDAVLRNLEIMGEAARHLPQDFQDQHASIPWREMIAIRNVIAHGYFIIELDIIWSTIHNDVLPLLPILTNLMASLQDEQSN